MSEPFVAAGHVLRRNWYLPLGAFALTLAGLVFALSRSLDAPLGWVAVVVGVIFGMTFSKRSSFPLGTAVALQATPRELQIGARAPIPVEDIVEAKVSPWPTRHGDHVIELVLRDRTRIAIATVQPSASVLFGVLGIAAGERRTTFPTVISFGARFVVTFVLMGGPWLISFASEPSELMRLIFVIPFSIAPTALFVAFLIGLIRGRVVIGAEGFTTRWLFWRRYVPFSRVRSIRGVKPVGNRFVLDSVVVIEGGRRVRIRSVETPDVEAQRGVESRALLGHLEQAYQRWRHARTTAEATPHLLRGRRSVRDWFTSLEHLVRGDGSAYRVAMLTPEVLTDVVRSTEGPLDARAGAAAALVRIGDVEHRRAVRIAAEACAEPTTRALLLDICDARSEDELQVVLARIDA